MPVATGHECSPASGAFSGRRWHYSRWNSDNSRLSTWIPLTKHGLNDFLSHNWSCPERLGCGFSASESLPLSTRACLQSCQLLCLSTSAHFLTVTIVLKSSGITKALKAHIASSSLIQFNSWKKIWCLILCVYSHLLRMDLLHIPTINNRLCLCLHRHSKAETAGWSGHLHLRHGLPDQPAVHRSSKENMELMWNLFLSLSHLETVQIKLCLTRQWTDGCFLCVWPWPERRAELLWAAEQFAGTHRDPWDPGSQFTDKQR